MKRSIVRNYLQFCMGFGIAMGMIFPVYASFFVVYKNQTAEYFFIAGCLMAGAVVGGLSFLIGKLTILKSIKEAKNISAEIIQTKNFRKRLNDESDDLLGEFATSFNRLLITLNEFLHNNSQYVTTLDSSAVELNQLCNQSAEDAHEVAKNTKGITSKAELSSNGTEMIKNRVELLSESVNVIASAAEEMASSVQEISRQCVEQNKIAERAKTDSQKTQEIVSQLTNGGRRIGEMTDSINDIAANIQLLALNASIEAASAGEAGKGFAVVANEVKELSKQTSDATKEIEQLVSNIRNNIGDAVVLMETGSTVIGELSNFTKTIEISVAQQSQASEELTSYLSQASVHSKEIEGQVTDINNSLKGIEREAKQLSGIADKTEEHCTQLNQHGSNLEEMAHGLDSIASQFQFKKSTS